MAEILKHQIPNPKFAAANAESKQSSGHKRLYNAGTPFALAFGACICVLAALVTLITIRKRDAHLALSRRKADNFIVVIGGVVGEKIVRHEICNREMSVHTLHLIIVFCLVVAVFTAFLREWFSPDLVALSAMGVLLVSGVLTADETLSVFSNSAPVVISCMFVLSAGLERTGVIDSLARISPAWPERLNGERRLLSPP